MPTRYRRPIRQRIYLALHLIIVVLSSLFALGIVLLVHWFEHTLFYNHLHNDLERNIAQYAHLEQPFERQLGDIAFYKLKLHDHSALPELLRGFPEGEHEVVVESAAYHLMISNRPPWTYAQVQDQSEFERYEILLFSSVIVGVLLIWGVGYRLSDRIADQILRPITQLADAVADKPTLQANPAPLVDDYPNDEVGALAQALDTYTLQLYELLQREQQFTANASHELRTPIMVIQSASDLLHEQLATDAASQRTLARINRAVQEMQAQIALFLRLSRSPEQLSDAETRQPLHELASAVQRQWLPSAEHKGLTLSCVTAADATLLLVPPTLTTSILNNLVRNAINHTEQGEVCIQLTERGFAVSDSGAGIAPELSTQILERGFSTGSGNDAQFGLGLAIVKRICTHQGWTLTLSPNSPQGTRIGIEISAA